MPDPGICNDGPTARARGKRAGRRSECKAHYPIGRGGRRKRPMTQRTLSVLKLESPMKVFTTGQVAKICKVAPRTVSKWFDSGRLKGYRIPGSQDRRIPREQLIRFLKEHGMPLGELEEEEWHKVLLIGTEKLFNDRLNELLPASEDYKFELANSGFEAGMLAGSYHPDTIIIDLGLGRSEAIQIVSNLRKDEAYTGTLIVGLASEDEAAPEQLGQYGFNDVFKKPFDVALLGTKIQSIADAKRED